MMLLTVADVVLRGLFNAPIRGVYELVELLLAYTFFVALPAVFLRDENIVGQRRRRSRAALGAGAQAHRGRAGGRRARRHGVARADRRPRHDRVQRRHRRSRPAASLHWIALLVGVIGAAIAALAMGLRGNGAAMSVAAIGFLGVAGLLLLIFARVPIAVALAGSRASRLRGARRLVAGAEDVRPRAVSAGERLFAVGHSAVHPDGRGRLARQHGDRAVPGVERACSPECAARWRTRPSAPARCSARSAARRSRPPPPSPRWRSRRCAATATSRRSRPAPSPRPARSTC